MMTDSKWTYRVVVIGLQDAVTNLPGSFVIIIFFVFSKLESRSSGVLDCDNKNYELCHETDKCFRCPVLYNCRVEEVNIRL